ncbi:hypothetical protein F7Q99_30255 [Streptomyces kaniharaensis]|uniref:Uncharacterized protein n=1 Tax=Streptomyces kaniharaensis TaxID=212423 RepID=A0A6N7KXK5_9ACTN|nr:hypothetical protein [Streptomyces kaniharaensis]MQS16372.1 hypothetical protein [Streptomyces kaniharaensis]
MSTKHTGRPGDAKRDALRTLAAELQDSGHTIIQIAWNLRVSPGTARRLLAEATREFTTPDPDRPAWFTGSDEKLAVLRRAAEARGVVLDPATPPSEENAQELTDELADVLLTEKCFDANWDITPFGDLVESLIDGLHRYAYPDEH